MQGVQRPGIDRDAFAQRFRDDAVEPGPASGPAEKIAGADHDSAHTGSRGLAQLLFDLDADAALACAGVLRRVLYQQLRHALAEVVDVARKHQQRAQAHRGLNGRLCQRSCLCLPLGVQRVGCVHHDAGRADRIGQRRRILQRYMDPVDSGWRTRRLPPHLRVDVPACFYERTRQRLAEASVGAGDENGFAHRRHRSRKC